MERSTKGAWMGSGVNDLVEKEVEDVPVKGQSVLVRALPARYSAQVSSQMKMVQGGPGGRDQYATVDVAEMEVLQFAHGVVDPEFSEDEARDIQSRFGPAFRKVIAVIDEISGVNKEAMENAAARFQGSGEGANGTVGSDGTPVGSSEPDGPVRTGARTGDVDPATG